MAAAVAAASAGHAFAHILLLFLVFSTLSSAHRHFPFPSNINPLCLAAPYPLLCAQLPPSSSTLGLAELAARAAASKISASIPAVNRIRSRFAKNKRVASALDVCAEVYADAVSDLNSAADALRGGAGNFGDVMTYLSAGVTDVGTCDDAFDEDPSLVNPVAHISKNLNRLVTNSLTLASAVKRSE
ncbi:putative pectinesterase/pectinesterase inhibitor 26 [Platanthera guangdongensis]|uniref:Pectinesterase/pectinesterase inhibitor 26 n=1 Tax=Platanthera guangdongensis TaxID=2320717 RepID=A0ABR2LL89_9ASPA